MYLHEIKNKELRRALLVLGYPVLIAGAILYGLGELFQFTIFIWNLENDGE